MKGYFPFVELRPWFSIFPREAPGWCYAVLLGQSVLCLAGVCELMAENMLSDRPEYGRTFSTVMWVVCSIATMQMIAVGFALLRKPVVTEVAGNSIPENFVPNLQVTTPVAQEQPEPQAQASVESPSIMREQPALMPRQISAATPPVVEPTIDDFADTEFSDPSFRIPDTSQTASRSVGFPGAGSPSGRESASGVLPQPAFHGPAGSQPSLSDNLSEAALSAPAIEGAILERLVSAGEEHRASGNMQAALRDLKDAETALPEHPRVLGGLAATYLQMGLDAKANAYWERLLELGPIRAGDYYAIAERQLKGEVVPSEGSTASVMKLGEVVVEKAPTVDDIQRVSLRVPIEADPSAEPSGTDMSLIVYFFDIVDGERIESSTADTSELYPTEPYDWQVNGREEIVVNYTQPAFSDEQIRELGHRSYYGYAIELYYRDQLQDKVVEPLEISHLQYPEMTGGESEPLSSPGPENALFPE